MQAKTFRLDDETTGALERLAGEQEISQTEVVRRAVKAALDDHEDAQRDGLPVTINLKRYADGKCFFLKTVFKTVDEGMTELCGMHSSGALRSVFPQGFDEEKS